MRTVRNRSGAFVIALVIALPALGKQIEFDVPRTVFEGGPVAALESLADVDGDGLVDLVRLTYHPPSLLQVALGRGDGSFSEFIDHPAPEGAGQTLLPGDFDGDGDVDFVSRVTVTEPADVAILLFRNDGAGGFAPEVVTAPFPGGTINPLQAYDFDSDGADELLVRGAGLMLMLLDIGPTGTISVPSSFGVIGDTGVLADLDSDGAPDLVTSRLNTVSVAFALQPGGSNSAVPIFRIPSGSGPARPIAAIDLDRDGDLDIVVDLLFGPIALVYDGIAGFSPEVLIENAAEQRLLRFADVDGDGFDDLFHARTTPPSGGALAWSRSTGSLPFDSGTDIESPIGQVFWGGAIWVGDLGTDGLAEYYALGDAYINDGSGASNPFTRAEGAPFTPGSPRSIALVDSDADGDLDLVAGGSGRDGIFVFENRSGFRFGQAEPLVRGQGGAHAIGPVMFDGDSLPGLAALEQSRGPMVFRADATGEYSLSVEVGTSFPFVDGLSRVEALDLYGTGANVVLAQTKRDAYALTFDQHGQFSGNVRVVWGLEEVSFADLDGDGMLDGLGRTANANNVQWWRNEGPGVPFSSVGVLFQPGVGAAAGDVDGDGQIDLVGITQNMILLRRGTGPSSFGPPEVLAAAEIGIRSRVRLLDVDGDGALDIVLRRRPNFLREGSIDVYRGDGHGAFALPVSIEVVVEPYGELAWGDLDADGDLDLWIFAGYSEGLLVVENRTISSVGSSLCAPAVVNSTGEPGELRAYGAGVSTSAPLRLLARGLPRNTFGIFIGSQVAQPPMVSAGSVGVLCLAAPIGRYDQTGEIGATGASGAFVLDIDVSALRTPSGPIAAMSGATWHFQAWYRDAPGGAPSNFTTGKSLTFE